MIKNCPNWSGYSSLRAFSDACEAAYDLPKDAVRTMITANVDPESIEIVAEPIFSQKKLEPPLGTSVKSTPPKYHSALLPRYQNPPTRVLSDTGVELSQWL
jgi:hypothetical protein